MEGQIAEMTGKESRITKISGKECRQARELWETVFSEDSAEFTEYYFRYKAENNIGYVWGKAPYEAMLFLTPYQVMMEEKKERLSYIVGVATRPQFRHRGRMRELLKAALAAQRQEGKPFLFLMPADPAIYTPFGFRYIYDRPEWELTDRSWEKEFLWPLCGSGRRESFQLGKEAYELQSLAGLTCLTEREAFSERLAGFAQERLFATAQVYVYRDKAYYLRQIEESAAQRGDVFVLLQGEHIRGFFLYAKEEEKSYIQDAMLPDDVEKDSGFFRISEYKPIIMARILEPAAMLSRIRSRESWRLHLRVRDDFLPENNAAYVWEAAPGGCRLYQETCVFPDRPLQAASADQLLPAASTDRCLQVASVDHSLPSASADAAVSVSIEELTELVFGRVSPRVWLEEGRITGETARRLECLIPLTEISLNEIV